MNLVAVNIETIRIGSPLPFALRAENGTLLARKGFVVDSRDHLVAIRGMGLDFYVDAAESESQQRAFVGKLHELVRDERPLGKIADAKLTTSDLSSVRADTTAAASDWLDLQEQCNVLLRDQHPARFPERLDRLLGELERHSLRNPDGTLFALIYLSSSELRMYSATHAMLVSVICGLAAREVLHWSAEEQATLRQAALTMNIGMATLQDRLAYQPEPPNPAQRQQINEHVEQSIAMLMQRGVTDLAWLEAVRHHHTNAPGPLQNRTTGLRMARLIQRADMFAARLAPRASRLPTSPGAAMQATYFDENRQIDEAGAALIKAVGIYQPGSFVRLATDEIALVVRRGKNTTTPRVAVVANRTGMPTGEHVIRDTSLRDHRIISSVARRDVKIQINLERFLPLTAAPSSRRFG
jgi:HD-GYP domain-containing protein (c-di-GMP phosphodiesterase class II)